MTEQEAKEAKEAHFAAHARRCAELNRPKETDSKFPGWAAAPSLRYAVSEQQQRPRVPLL